MFGVGDGDDVDGKLPPPPSSMYLQVATLKCHAIIHAIIVYS